MVVVKKGVVLKGFHCIYNFTWSKAVCNLLVCLAGCGWVIVFDKQEISITQLNFFYVFAIAFRITLFASSIIDFLLILNRYFIIIKRNIWLVYISKLKILALSLIFPIFVYIPFLFVIEMEHEKLDEEHPFFKQNFSKFKLFSIYAAGTFVLEILIGIVVLGFLSVFLIVNLNKKMARNRHLLTTESEKTEVKYTIMTVTLTSISLVARSVETVATILRRLVFSEFYEFSDETASRIILFNKITYLFFMEIYLFDILIFLFMDPYLKMSIKDIFLWRTNRNLSVNFIVKCFIEITL